MVPGYQGLSEDETRKQKIDVELRKSGWEPKDPSLIIEECDTLQSDFKKHHYLTYSQTYTNEKDSKYVDYLLLDSNGAPLAVLEAKRVDKDPLIGQEQVKQYAEHIKQQNDEDVFRYFTNGDQIWFWNYPHENPRQVWRYHDQAALERIRFQNKNRKSLPSIHPREDIINRDYQIEAAKRVLEHLEKGHRKALVVMATGTGKTRVSMALIDCLLRANAAQKVLFLADRRVLRDQAKNKGFKQFFPQESKSTVISGNLDKDSRLYVSTIQTLMEVYKDVNPGFFDVIVFDEAHRSYYNKWNDAFQYFDALKIGLTATPAEMVDRDTFRLFGCYDGVPTFNYTYDQAIEDGYLVPYTVTGAQTNFQLTGIKQQDVPQKVQEKLLVEKGIDPHELDFTGTDIERKVAITGTVEAHVREFMENSQLDSTGTLPAKTIFFAVSKMHAKRIWEAFERLYPEHKGRLARVIVSEDSRALDIKADFEKNKFPRVAISVDMLDTGVDVPEVCNLVFAKPVFSKIKFWQMIGRGTRPEQACEHMEWLPDGKKESFLIFDFWNNFEYHQMHTEEAKKSSTEAITTRIFNMRIEQLTYFEAQQDEEGFEKAKAKLIEDIKSLPQDTVAVKERIEVVEKALTQSFWKGPGAKPAEHLKKYLSPLMRYQTEVNINRASFTLKVERLALAVIKGDQETKERLKEEIAEMVRCLPSNLDLVKAKQEVIDQVLSQKFWEKLTYADTITLLDELAPIMHLKRKEPRQQIVLDIDDVIRQRKLVEFGPMDNLQTEYADKYREKVESKVKELAEEHPTIQKIRNDQVLNEEDLAKLEETLNQPELYVTEDTLQEAYGQYSGTLIQFIKKILGLYEFPDPKERIEEEFKRFVVEQNYLDADKVNFIRALKTVFSQKKHIEYKDFFNEPFINFGAKAPTPLFKEDELKEMVNMCTGLEKEIFS